MVKAELFVPGSGGYQRMVKLPLREDSLPCPEGPYLQEWYDGAQHLTAPRANGTVRFDVALPRGENARQMVSLPGRLITRTDRHLLSLDAETGEEKGRVDFPNVTWTRKIFAGHDGLALIDDRTLVRYDADLNEIERHPLHVTGDRAVPVPGGAWLVTHRSQQKATVLGPDGFTRTSAMQFIPDSDAIGPDGRVWMLDRTSRGVDVIACGSTGPIQRFPLDTEARLLRPTSDGFLTVTAALSAPEVRRYDLEGNLLGAQPLGPGKIVTLLDRAALIEHQGTFRVQSHAGDVLHTSAYPSRVAQLPDGDIMVVSREGATRLGSGTREFDLHAFYEQAEAEVGFPYSGPPRPGLGRDGAWNFPPEPGTPPVEPERPPSLSQLFAPAGETTEGLYPDRPDLRLVVKPDAIEVRQVGIPNWKSHTRLEEPVSSATPLLFGEDPGYLAATQTGMIYYLDGSGGRITFDLDSPLARLTVHEDRLVAEGTNGNVLVIHPEKPAVGPASVQPRPADAPLDEAATTIAESDQGVAIGGVFIRRKKP